MVKKGRKRNNQELFSTAKLSMLGTTSEGMIRLLLSDIPNSELVYINCPVCNSKRRKFLFKEYEFPHWKCSKCTHVYVSPQPSQSVLDSLNKQESDYFTVTNGGKIDDSGRINPFKSVLYAVEKFMPQRGNLLEVGSGFGGFLKLAVNDGWRVHGVEPSKLAYEVSKKRLGLIPQIQNRTFDEAELAPGSFDCIVMINIIEHVCEPLEICERAFRLLLPGGCIALRWPQTDYIRRTLGHPRHLHGFTGRSMKRLLNSTGFVEVEEFWTDIQYYKGLSIIKKIAMSTLSLIGKVVLFCTLKRYQIPLVSRITIARKKK